ncbi:hypothetical protein Patl1_29944 [Pistacia atlantica]|uniref:Uncharacterized protein n=1 Tax=Pistacia atlantica TaxID=434234 RepID=A0ACC1ACB2_9ROSI|nr:hypothetical protein Patl1_29944 [Pistacia atlantica]
MSSTTTAHSSAPAKVSKFAAAAKAGFVIPKNKLSGSLVPVFKGAKKPGSNDVDSTVNEEKSVSKAQRKTKWVPDLTEDAGVRRGRLLAYQTRVDQIAQQLKLGVPDVEDNQDLQLADQHDDQKSSNPQADSEKLKLLEIEKQEVIGEILRLNPSYKIPPDYKPLLKEAIVPIPVKEYQGYNFLGLIFGPASDTQKRLEKETGTIIQVYGTKAGTGEKVEIDASGFRRMLAWNYLVFLCSLPSSFQVEISPSDGNVQSTFEELYINISADTYEKVDAAADLIELLVNSVSVRKFSCYFNIYFGFRENANALSQGQDEGNPFVIPSAAVNQRLAPVIGPMHTPVQGQFQYQSPWFPPGPPQTPMHPLNSSAPISTNPVNMPSLFGPRPAGFTSTFPNSPLVPQNSLPPIQVPPYPYMPQIHPLGHAGPSSSFPMPSQPSSAQGALLDGQEFLQVAAASLGSSNMGQMAPVMVPPQGLRPGVSRPGVAANALPNMSARNMASPSFPSGPSSTALNRPAGPFFPSGPPPRVGSSPAFPASAPMQSSPLVPMAASSGPSISPPNFSTINPACGTPSRPQLPGSGDFTFLPHQPQNLAPLTVPRPSSQPMMMNTPPHRPMMQLPSPQAPSFRLTGPSATAQPVMQGFPRPQVGNQMGQPQAPMFARNPNAAFANVSPVAPTTPVSQMRPRNFGTGLQVPNLAGPFPPRPGNPLQLQQNYPAPANRHQNHIGLIQQFGNDRPFTSDKLAPSPRGPQIYDPFSPTASIAPQQQGANPAVARKQENDPEYEDLMASVGVK